MSPLRVAAVLKKNELLGNMYSSFPVVSDSNHLHGMVSRHILAKALRNQGGRGTIAASLVEVAMLAANERRAHAIDRGSKGKVREAVYTLTVHSLYTHYTLTIHSLYTHYTPTIHPLYTHCYDYNKREGELKNRDGAGPRNRRKAYWLLDNLRSWWKFSARMQELKGQASGLTAPSVVSSSAEGEWAPSVASADSAVDPYIA